MRRACHLLVIAVVVSACFLSCSSDHSALKQKDPPATGGSGGTGGGIDAGPDVELDQGVAGFVEPPGENKLTLLHGVVDAVRVAFCFAKVVDGLPEPVQGNPIPTAGLPYAGSLSVTQLAGLDWTKDAVLPIVIAGDLSLVAGKSCSQAISLAQSYALEDAGGDGAADVGVEAAVDGSSDAADDSSIDASMVDASGGDAADAPVDAVTELPPPPKLRVGELPVLPAGTLSSGYSLLLAATGCIGGPAFSDPLETYVCGATYTPSSPTLAPVVVPLSRVSTPGALGLQLVNAARAADPIDVSSRHPKGSSIPDIDIADGVVFGAVAPRPPLLGYSSSAFGSPLSASFLDVWSQNSSAPFYSSSWKDALGPLDDAHDGKTYAVVLIGPRPNNTGQKWWNGPRLVVLDNDP